MSFHLNVVAHPTKRYISVLIDGLIIGLLILPVLVYSYQQRLIQNEEFILVFYFFLYKVLIYVLFDIIIPTFNKGRTIGRFTQQIRLVSTNGNDASWSHYVRRGLIFIVLGIIGDVLLLGWLAYVLSTLIVITSIILLYTDEHRRTVHDFVASTMVVNDTTVLELEEE